MVLGLMSLYSNLIFLYIVLNSWDSVLEWFDSIYVCSENHSCHSKLLNTLILINLFDLLEYLKHFVFDLVSCLEMMHWTLISLNMLSALDMLLEYRSSLVHFTFYLWFAVYIMFLIFYLLLYILLLICSYKYISWSPLDLIYSGTFCSWSLICSCTFCSCSIFSSNMLVSQCLEYCQHIKHDFIIKRSYK